jgi:type I restriction enzyme S subunit
VGWSKVPIGEIFRLKQGTYLKPSEMADEKFSAFPFPVYGANGVIGYSNKKMYSARTTLISCRGANCGVVHYTLPDAYISNNSIACIPNAEICADFYYYVCLNTDFRDVITGAAQPQITITNLSSKHLIKPPISTQRRISGILSAYDDLIENCQRRIQILEEMARSLYREWFVNFRYPGHESVPLFPSALGELPQGWEVKKLHEMCLLTMGQSPKSDFYNTSGEGIEFHQGVTDFGDRFPSSRLFCTAPGRTAEIGDILFSVRAPVGKMNLANKRIVLGRGLSSIRHKRGYQEVLWEQLRNKFTQLDMMGNGAIFASVTKDDMQGIDLISPPADLVESATRQLKPLHLVIETLSKSIQNLRQTRDLLLPRLMSGQLEVTVD